MRPFLLYNYGNRFFMDNVMIAGQNILAIQEATTFHTSIYPNPTKGIFSIRTDVDDLEVEIFTTLGKLIWKEKISGRLEQIDLSTANKGIYFVKLKNGNKTEKRKLVVQ